MGRKTVQVETLYGYSLEQLIELQKKSKDVYECNMLSVIIGKCEGKSTSELAKGQHKAISTIIEYIHKWNEQGLDALNDKRGGSIGHFTDEMVETLRKAILDETPLGYGYSTSIWTIEMLKDLICEKYNVTYSWEWIRRIVIDNGFTYKRGQFTPTLGNKEEQELFKKNARSTRHCRKQF